MRAVRGVGVGAAGVFAGVFGVGGAVFRSRNCSTLQKSDYQLEGRSYVVTGGTSGIGRSAVHQLLASGASVIVGARDQARGKKLLEETEQLAGSCEVLPLDLADPTSVAAFANSVSSRVAELDGLLNNAAVIECAEGRTADGVELTFATNQLGPFQLTKALLPLLEARGSAQEHTRVVTVGSRLESQGSIDMSVLRATGAMHPPTAEHSAMVVYGSSKQANLMMTMELNRKLQAAESPVDVLCVSPGMVDTGLWRNYPTWYQTVTFPFRRLFLRTADEAANGIVLCLVAPEMHEMSGKFVYDGKPIEPSAAGADPKLAAALWETCNHLLVKGGHSTCWW